MSLPCPGSCDPPEPLQLSPVWGQDGKGWGQCVGPVGYVPLPPGQCLAVGQSRDPRVPLVQPCPCFVPRFPHLCREITLAEDAFFLPF